MAAGGGVDMKMKNTHLEEEEGWPEDSVGICVIRRSLSLAATLPQCWTATRREKEGGERKNSSYP